MTNNINHFKEIVDNAWIKHSKDQFRARTAQDMEILIQTCLMPLALKIQNDSFIFVHEHKQEMHADLKYVEYLEKEIDELESDKAEFSNMYNMILQECVSNNVVCSYLLSLSDLDAQAKLQCLYLHKVKECDCPAENLLKQTESVSKEVHSELLKRFEKIGTKFLNKTLNAFFKEEGIEHPTSTAQTPEQNAVVERRNRTLVEAARTMLSASKLPDGENLDKMKEKGDLCILVGYSTQPKGYRVYNKRTRLIVESIHIHFDEIKEMSETSVANDTSDLKDVVIGLPKLKYVKDQLCSSCEMSKAKISLFKSKVVPSLRGRLNLLHMDLCGPMRVTSIYGKKYILVIEDDYLRYTWTLFLQGIEHQTSTARTHEQNGVDERQNRTLVEATRTMLSASRLPLFFWAKAIATACYTQNQSIIIPTHDKTTHHIINDRKPSIKHLYSFGCTCYITRDGENSNKMKEKGDLCILVGYSSQSKGYRVYNKRTRMIVESIHIRFNEIKEVSETSVANDTLGLEELHQFDRLQVWELIDKPFGKTVIKLKWLWKNKKDEDQTIICNKARIVAKGYDQEGDGRENGISQWSTEGGGFVAQPDGFIDPDHLKKVYRLRKALYGLKQAPRARSTNSKYTKRFEKILHSRFEMSLMGEMKFFLGLQIHQSPCGIFINQAKYALEILHKHGMEKGQSISTLMATKPKLDADLSGNPVEQTDYHSKIGSLMYLTSSRPDIVQAKRVLDIENTKTTQAMEIEILKRRVKKLEKKQMSRTHKLKRLYKVGLTARVESSDDNEDLGEDASKQGRISDIDADESIALVSTHDDAKMFDVDKDLHGEEEFVAKQDENVVEKEVDAAQIQFSTAATTATILIDKVTLAQALSELKHTKPKSMAKGIIFHEPEQSTTTTTATIPKPKSQDTGKKLKDLKNKSFDSIQKMFDKAFKRVSAFEPISSELVEESSKKAEAEVTERSSKRAGTELEQESSKKQNIDGDKEITELNQLVKIIPNEEGVAIDAIPLAVKPPSIVDWKIHKEGKKSFYKIIRADGCSKIYLVFNHMLKSFDREDVKLCGN
uniref:Retroviral polymerase SH3-like domain-containing protein n=1 Tax=Tanacetum cinerariifolium TaxID=118510 RepID=A0A6L2JHG4_TANCI|nr:hypothetical protein [Tanacetum cinerariifolium]